MKNLSIFFQKHLQLTLVIFLSFNINAQVSFTTTNPLGTANGSGDCAVDMNGDYLDDVVRVSNSKLYIDYQQPDGSFTQNEFSIPFQSQPSWSICAGDIDNNGFNDLLFGDGNSVSFIYANNDGSEYTEDYHPEYIFSQRSTFADINNDGHLDAFVCHDVDQSHPYLNDGNGGLSLDQSLIETLDMPGNYAAIWVDYNNDGNSDLYITKCKLGSVSGDPHRTNRMYHNNGDGTYTEVAEQINLADNAQSWATVFEDFDNDGDFDAFIVNHDFQNRFYRNDDGVFVDIIDDTGILAGDLGAWEAMGGDFNNDGFVDIYSQLNRELYLNNGNMTFTGHDLPTGGGAIGDFNNDGFIDLVSGPNILLNDGNDNNWVKINTQGIISNRNGIGAQSFSPMHSLTTFFGIGDATEIDQLIVKWPSGVISTIDNPEINTTHLVPETSCLLANSEIIVTGSTSICPGESVTLEAPTGFDNYSWSNGDSTQMITVTEAGNYSVNSSNADDCISLSNVVGVTINEDVVPVISIMGDDIICSGETVQLTVDQGTNPTWSNGMTGSMIEISESGTYSVSIDGECVTTPLASNEIVIEVLEVENPIADDVEITGPGMATLTAEGENLEWYDVEIDGQPIGFGNTFETPMIDMNQTYYVEAHRIEGGANQDGGKPDFEGGGGLPSSGAYSYFNAYESFTILTVAVRVPAAPTQGMRDIQLVDANENILQEVSFDLTEGDHILELNFDVPVGDAFSLRCPQNNLFRNNQGVSYPYPIGDVGEITTSFFGNSYYYYFYDWKIQKEEIICDSDRIPVNVSVLTSNDDLEKTVASLDLFPNPASEKVFIEMDAIESTTLLIDLMDATGKQVGSTMEVQTSIGHQSIAYDVNHLPKGIYYFQFNANGQTAGRKIIVQ